MWVSLARLYHLSGDPAKAESFHNALLQGDKGSSVTYADFLTANGNLTKAEQILQASLAFLSMLSSTMQDSHLNRVRRHILNRLANLKRNIETATRIEQHVRNVWAGIKGNGSKATRLAIFGAGKHTAWLHRIVKRARENSPEVVAILDDQPSATAQTYWGLSPILAATWNPAEADLVVLSSDTIPAKMRCRCLELYGERIRLMNLYEGMPPGPYPKLQDNEDFRENATH